MTLAHLSRRSFMKTAFAGVGAALVSKNIFGAVGSETNITQKNQLTLAQASDLLRTKNASPVELTRACLERIKQLNPKLNAFITVTAESALAEARQAESEIHGGHWRGPLHGIPIALKDLIDTAGVRTTAASALFKDRIPSADAEIVRRLKGAGAVSLGKL